MNVRPRKIVSSIFFGVVLPTALIAVGAGMFIALGKAEPKQVAKLGNDLAGKLSQLPIVETRSSISFEGQEMLDIDLNGVVVPYRDVTIAAEVAGRIAYKSDLCRAGRFVNAGDVLFRIDARDFELEVDRVSHIRDQEYAQLREWEQEVANTNRSMKLAVEELQLNEKEIKRLQSLPAGFVSETEMDQARRVRLLTANQQQSLRNQLDLLQTRRNRVDLAQQLASTQLEQAKLNLARTEVKAPISGLIINENVETDSYVQRGATLCQIEDTEKVEVRCNLRMDQLVLILDQKQSEGAVDLPTQATHYELPPTPVSILYRYAGRDDLEVQWEGRLNRYEGIGIDPQSRTVPCRIQVDDPRSFTVNGKRGSDAAASPPALVRGMFVDARIHTKPSRPLLMLPKLALRPGNLVWKFTEDPTVLDEIKSDSSLSDSSSGGAGSQLQAADEQTSSVSPSPDASPPLNPDAWLSGRIRVLRNMRVIRLVEAPTSTGQSAEYWVVESREDAKPGERFVVTPLANLKGDGTDAARVRKEPAIR